MSWWKGRSLCPQCKHTLAWYDLIPLLSYLILGGKCRYCHRLIPLRYLLVELVMAAGFGYLHSPILAALLFVTVIIAVMDWESMLVSDWMVVIWGGLVVVSSGIRMGNVWGVLVGLGVIGGIWMITKGKAMGFGDVEIAAILGLWLGWPKTIYALWLAFVSGAIVGVYLLISKEKKLTSRIAFGPFLILGGWIGYVWGERIISWLF